MDGEALLQGITKAEWCRGWNNSNFGCLAQRIAIRVGHSFGARASDVRVRDMPARIGAVARAERYASQARAAHSCQM